MDTFDPIYDLICLLSDWRFTVLASLTIAVLAALIGLTRGRRASLWAGGVAGLVALVILGGVNWLLNAPMGPPLPGAQALPPDYTGFWLPMGILFAAGGLLGLVLLFAIWRSLEAIRVRLGKE